MAENVRRQVGQASACLYLNLCSNSYSPLRLNLHFHLRQKAHRVKPVLLGRHAATSQSREAAYSASPPPAPRDPTIPKHFSRNQYSRDRQAPAESADPTTPSIAESRRAAATSDAGKFRHSPDTPEYSPSGPPGESSATQT